MSRSLKATLLAVFFSVLLAPSALAQIPNQLASDFVAGDAPGPDIVAQAEKDAAANPADLRLVRKLGKAYFFQFFGDGDVAAVPRSEKTLERALAIKPDDGEATAYLGALHVFAADRLEKNAAKKKARLDRGFELLKRAESLEPDHGAVISVVTASYIVLPHSYGMAAHVVELLEGMLRAMGPAFKRFAHHGQQRLLMTLGQAYVKTGNAERARALFDQALAINLTSREAGLLRHQIAKLPSGKK